MNYDNERQYKKQFPGWLVGLLVTVGIIFIMVAWAIGSYNGLVSKKVNVDNSYAKISTQLQRRGDLIPNLVNTVKGYTSHENEVLTQISNARAQLSGASSVNEKSVADQELSNALNRLLVVVENYPNLKADAQFTALMDELAGTENRIAVARTDYNSAVATYNQATKTFPSMIFAGMFGFSEADYFQADADKQSVPSVNFA